MPVRENLVNGAVSLLQSPEVAHAPQDQKIAFLKAKNLTPEEIDLAFQRASTTPQYAQPQYPQYDDRYPPRYNYPPPYPYSPPQAPPPLPARDWRDWFIMATVIGGVGYAATSLAKRYIVPLIAPPTPEQLTQDKYAIDASFEKTFALLDQVVADTEKLKLAEQERTERLDVALSEVESVLAELKAVSARKSGQEGELGEQVRKLQDLVPKAMQGHADATEQKLKDLSGEVRSLKTLLSSKVGAGTSVAGTTGSGVGAGSSIVGTSSSNGTTTSTVPAPSVADTYIPSNGVTPKPSIDSFRASEVGSNAGSPYARLMNGRAAIPAWQMAAAGSPVAGGSGSGAGNGDASGSASGSGNEVKARGSEIAASG